MRQKNYKMRLILAVLFLFFAIGGIWISGFNFNERGGDAAMFYVFSILAFLCGITCPLFDDKGDLG